MVLYVYVAIVDWFAGWGDVAQEVEQIEADLANGTEGPEAGWDELDVSFLRAYNEAYARALQEGWEGDGTWRYSALPDFDYCMTRWVFCVKQSNNGSTFVLSPFPLAYLERYSTDTSTALRAINEEMARAIRGTGHAD